MCREVLKAVKEGNQVVIEDVKLIAGEERDSSWLPSSTKIYMPGWPSLEAHPSLTW